MICLTVIVKAIAVEDVQVTARELASVAVLANVWADAVVPVKEAVLADLPQVCGDFEKDC